MAAEIINITNFISHPAIFKPEFDLHFESYQDLCDNNQVVITFQDNRCGVTTNYTDERHKKTWLTMVAVSFDARDNSYTLARKTFENDNMVIVEDCNLRFRELWATTGSSEDISDFAVVADKIEVAMGGTIFVDVHRLIKALTDSCNVLVSCIVFNCN